MAEAPTNQEPIQLDLQKPDISKLQLTPEQQTEFTKYLEQKERKEIIHLTQEELLELRKIIQDDITDGARNINTFIENQERESTSSHEIIKDIEWIPNSREILTGIDNLSYSLLFWSDSVFKDSGISEDAKRNFSTAFSLYIFENIPQGATLDIQNATLILKNFIEKSQVENTPQLSQEAQKFWEKINTVLNNLKQIKDFKPDNWWEKNTVLMNPTLWLDFLKKIDASNWADLLSKAEWELTPSEAEKEKISKSLSPKIKEALKGFSETKDKPDNLTLEKLKSDPTMLESLKTLADNKLFGPFFKFVLSILWIGNLNEAIDGAYYGKIKEHFTKLTKEKNLIITDGKLWDDFMMNRANKDMSFVSNLRRLHEKWKPDEAFLKNILANGSELDQIIKAKKWEIKNWDNINYKNLSEWVSLLLSYNAEKVKPENKDLTIEQYIESLNKPKKEVGKEKTESIKWTNLEKKISEGKTVISWNETPNKKLELIEENNTIIFKYNWKKYHLDISWFPDSLFSQKKPTIKIEWDNLIITWWNKDWKIALSQIYSDLTKSWEAVLIENYWWLNDLVIEQFEKYADVTNYPLDPSSP